MACASNQSTRGGREKERQRKRGGDRWLASLRYRSRSRSRFIELVPDGWKRDGTTPNRLGHSAAYPRRALPLSRDIFYLGLRKLSNFLISACFRPRIFASVAQVPRFEWHPRCAMHTYTSVGLRFECASSARPSVQYPCRSIAAGSSPRIVVYVRARRGKLYRQFRTTLLIRTRIGLDTAKRITDTAAG